MSAYEALAKSESEEDRAIARALAQRSIRRGMEQAARGELVRRDDLFDPADDMCENCITPWKCNGPHDDDENDTALVLARQANDSGQRTDLDDAIAAFGFDRAELEAELSDERADVLRRFTDELAKATGDGSRKRAAGTKPPWYEDDSHEAAVFSHIMKWKRGELVDPDSGAHPLSHAAWRLLAIALRETGNVPS